MLQGHKHIHFDVTLPSEVVALLVKSIVIGSEAALTELDWRPGSKPTQTGKPNVLLSPIECSTTTIPILNGPLTQCICFASHYNKNNIVT